MMGRSREVRAFVQEVGGSGGFPGGGLYHAHADRLNILTERGGNLCQKCLRTKEAGGGAELLKQREGGKKRGIFGCKIVQYGVKAN